MLNRLKEIGLSDELAEKIDLFLVNGPLSNEQKNRTIDFLMLVYIEGKEGRLKDIEDRHGKFMSDFSKKLHDGLDSKDKETTQGS